MKKRLRAVTGLSYPDAKSLEIVLRAGGMSKLSGEQRKKIKRREVKPGDWCDDLPEISRAYRLGRGDVEEVDVSPARPPKKGAK
jgi:hypothetical protein